MNAESCEARVPSSRRNTEGNAGMSMKGSELLKCVRRGGVPFEFERSCFAGANAVFARVADLDAEVRRCRESAWRPK